MESTHNQQLAYVRAQTDRLFECVDPAAMYDRPIPERHRMIFYLGHVEAFDLNLLRREGAAMDSREQAFDQLFAFGIDPEPGRLPHDQPSDWPSLEQVRQYVQDCRELVDRDFAEASEDTKDMMIEHRHMHAETFAYILHNLDADKKRGPFDAAVDSAPVALEMREIAAGKATLGRPEGSGFGWDNEFLEFQTNVPAFAASRFKVTNGEYLAYVQEGGAVPHYWFQQDGRWWYRGMFQNRPLPLDWPVYATWEQARSFAEWRGLALPSEAQYHRAAFGTPEGGERVLPWNGNGSERGNFGYWRWDPVPVQASPGDDSAFGVAQTIGNGWEWTSTVFGPFAGFAPRPSYPGYSSDFFDNQHYVMKGASPRTAAKLVRRSMRNWFRPEYPYVYATFRVVQN